MMLKGIPKVISPELLKLLAEMGHGDRIAIGDAYFPSASLAKPGRLIRADGIDCATLVDAILQLMPLDNWVDHSVTFMGKPGEDGKLCPCEMTWRLSNTVAKYDEAAAKTAVYVDRYDFYERVRGSFAVIASGERENYGCVILQKGVK